MSRSSILQNDPGADEAVSPGGANRIRLLGRSIPLPANRPARITIGVILVVAGILGFLPVLGFWMIPLGLLVLSVDLILVRKWRRRAEIRWGRWRRRRGSASVADRGN